jgi:hypothetical protein
MIFAIKIIAGLIAIGVLIARGEIVTALAIVAISSMIEALERKRGLK